MVKYEASISHKYVKIISTYLWFKIDIFITVVVKVRANFFKFVKKKGGISL